MDGIHSWFIVLMLKGRLELILHRKCDLDYIDKAYTVSENYIG